MVSPRNLRPFIDGTIPAPQRAQRLLMPSRQDSTATFIAKEGELARVYYPVDSTNEVVAPAQPGIYPKPGTGGIVPVLLGADGRISQALPPVSADLDNAEAVGDAGELLLEVPANRELLDAHEAHLVEIGETIAEIDEHNRDVVDPFIRDADHALTVELPAAKQVAQDAQAKAIEALTQGNKGVTDAAEAKAVADQAKADAQAAKDAGLVKDTRNDNQPPAWYWTNYPKAGVVWEFKLRTVMEAPGTGSFGQLRTNVRWSNPSGGAITQELILDSGDVLIRSSVGGTLANPGAATWGPWTNRAADAQATADNALYIGNMAAELAAGMVWVDETEPPFDSRVDGQVWIKINADGQMEGVYRLRDASTAIAQWDTYTVLTGLLIVPGENGTPTIIDQNGLTVGQIEADAITTGVLAAESVGAKQLIIGEITRAHLDAGVDGVLSDAEAIASRVVIDPSSITISRSVVGSQGKLTALRLEATKMDFIVDGKSVAYIDSNKNLMSIGNAYVRDALQIGEHQVRRLGQGGITVFQYVGV